MLEEDEKAGIGSRPKDPFFYLFGIVEFVNIYFKVSIFSLICFYSKL